MPFDFPAQQAQHIARQIDRSTDRLTEKTAAVLLLILGEMAEEVAYRISIGQHPLPIGGQQKWSRRLREAQEPLGRAAAILGYNFAADLMTQLSRPTHGITEDGMEAGFLYNSIDQYYMEASSRQANTFTRKVESSVRKNTERLDQEQEAGKITEAMLSAAVLLDLDKFKKTYSDMAAVSGMVWSSREGAVKAYLKSGVIRWRWTTRGDDRVCPFCQALDGEVVSTSGYFARANERMPATKQNAAGEDVTVYLQIPAWNIQHPPLHARCRCFLLPYE